MNKRRQWALIACAVGLTVFLAGLALRGVWNDLVTSAMPTMLVAMHNSRALAAYVVTRCWLWSASYAAALCCAIAPRHEEAPI